MHPTQPLTAADSRAPRQIADEFTRSSAVQGGLSLRDFPGIYLAKEYQSSHNGVTHFLYRQRFGGLDVVNAEWVVNVDRDGRVLNAGGQLFQGPEAGATGPDSLTVLNAGRAALQSVNPALAERVRLTSTPGKSRSAKWSVRLASADLPDSIDGRPVWYALNGVPQSAWPFVVTDEDGISRYSTVVDSRSSAILASEPLTFFQAPAPPRGLVFTGRSPQPPVQPGVQSSEPPPYAQRELRSFRGDPAASPQGWFSGTTTSGNNVIAGWNPRGISFLRDPAIASSTVLDFQFPLELGPGTPHPTYFRDAALTNLFYWANTVHDFFYNLGFDEKAGNYQADNFGQGGVAGDPISIYAHFGAASTSSFAQVNNAFYSTFSTEDGTQAMVGMFLGSSRDRWADGAYSTETIVHELTHGVTARLIRSMNTTFQGAAMNEAFSDFWAHELITPEGSPVDGVYPYGEYLYNQFGVGIRSRPYSTNMEINPLTYRDLGRATSSPAIHNDGGIWVVSLWDVRANMIRQFGEREGRRRLRQNVLDGMKLAPPAPSMVDLRDAVLLADRVNFRGESQAQMWEGFAKRGLGVLAYSNGGDTIQVKASFEKPSKKGSVGFTADRYTIGEPVRIMLNDENEAGTAVTVTVLSSSGDQESVILRGSAGVYTATINTTQASTVNPGDRTLSILPGDWISVYYNDADTGTGPGQVSAAVPTQPSYAAFVSTPPQPITTQGETLLLRTASTGVFARLSLPWDFPFYGGTFREIRVYSDGLIGFDTALATGCYDMASLARFAGVAPIWMGMRTNGFALNNEGVYFSRPAPDSLQVHWVGETLPSTGGAAGIDAAAILYQDGRVEFRYGANANQNLTSSALAFAGCGTTLPVAGISKGNGTYSQFSTSLNGRSNFSDAPTVTWYPPFNNSTVPIIRLENPVAGGVYRGAMQVRGLVYDGDTTVTNVFVLIDGVYRQRPTVAIARPDVCATESLPGCPSVGFLANLNFADLRLAEGPHTIQIRAVNRRGAIANYPEQPLTFNVVPGDDALPKGAVTSPAPGASVTGPLQVAGYAYGSQFRVSYADVLVDGVVYGRAIYGLARPELCAGEAQGSPNCPGIGFTFSLNPLTSSPVLTSGTKKLQVRVFDEAGRATLIPETPVEIVIDTPSSQVPVGVLTTPTNLETLSGTVRISGHAWDPDGRITQVQLLINGSSRGMIPYGRPRPEVCADLTGVAGCPNIGFELDFDTRVLTNGLYNFGILLVDNSGATSIIPKVTNGGMNVRVQN